MKTLLALAFILASLNGYSQVELDYNGGNAQFQKVIEVPGKRASELYPMVNRWVAMIFNNPDAATYSKIENEMIKGEGSGDIKLTALAYAGGRFSWRVDVKDNKVRFTMDNMRVVLTSGAYSFEMYVFKDDGRERTNSQAQNVKESFQERANVLILSLSNSVLDTEQSSDDW